MKTLKSNSKRFYKGETNKFFKDLADKRREAERTMFQWFDQCHNDGPSTLTQADISAAKRALLEIEIQKLETMGCKAKLCTEAEDEKVGLAHIGNIQTGPTQIVIVDEENRTLNRNEIKCYVYNEFKKIFDDDNTTALTDLSVSDLPKLGESERRIMSRVITIDEIKEALELCKRKKSPGIDELTYEFYIQNFEILAPDMVVFLMAC